MRTVFADTFYYIALLFPNDVAHQQATAFTASLKGRMVTTAWVLTELANAMSAPRNRIKLLAFLDHLRNDSAITIVPATQELFDEGMELYRNRPDKEWSLTDCISFVVMGRDGLTEALTGDHHFEQAGFTALLK